MGFRDQTLSCMHLTHCTISLASNDYNFDVLSCLTSKPWELSRTNIFLLLLVYFFIHSCYFSFLGEMICLNLLFTASVTVIFFFIPIVSETSAHQHFWPCCRTPLLKSSIDPINIEKLILEHSVLVHSPNHELEMGALVAAARNMSYHHYLGVLSQNHVLFSTPGCWSPKETALLTQTGGQPLMDLSVDNLLSSQVSIPFGL